MNIIHIVTVVVSVATGVYEVVVRVIPTVKNYSLLHKIIGVLQKVSEFLNITK